MGVVDDHPERLALVDPLHPAGHAGDALETRPNRIGREPETLAERDDRERVVDVEAAGKSQVEASLTARRRVPRPQPRCVLLDPGRTAARPLVGSVGDAAGARLARYRHEEAGRGI